MIAVIGLTHLRALNATDSVQRKRLGKISNDILDLSKIEAGKPTPGRREFWLHQGVTAAIDTLTQSASRKQTELVLGIRVTAPGCCKW